MNFLQQIYDKTKKYIIYMKQIYYENKKLKKYSYNNRFIIYGINYEIKSTK